MGNAERLQVIVGLALSVVILPSYTANATYVAYVFEAECVSNPDIQIDLGDSHYALVSNPIAAGTRLLAYVVADANAVDLCPNSAWYQPEIGFYNVVDVGLRLSSTAGSARVSEMPEPGINMAARAYLVTHNHSVILQDDEYFAAVISYITLTMGEWHITEIPDLQSLSADHLALQPSHLSLYSYDNDFTALLSDAIPLSLDSTDFDTFNWRLQGFVDYEYAIGSIQSYYWEAIFDPLISVHLFDSLPTADDIFLLTGGDIQSFRYGYIPAVPEPSFWVALLAYSGVMALSRRMSSCRRLRTNATGDCAPRAV